MKRILILLTLALLLVCQPALAVSFDIDSFDMDIEILQDGSARIVETLVYAFDGEYNGMTATIRHNTSPAEDIVVFVDCSTKLSRVDSVKDARDANMRNTFEIEREGKKTHIRTYTPGTDGRRTFTISYHLPDFASRYLDAGYINQMLLRAENSYGTSSYRITFPGNDMQLVTLYTHGAAYQTTQSYQQRSILFDTGFIRSGGFVEILSVFPQEWLPKANTIQKSIRDTAEKLEENVQKHNGSKSAARIDRINTMRPIGMVTLLLYALIAPFLLLHMQRRYGFVRQSRPVSDQPLLDRLPAALAEAVYRLSVSADGLTASLMELVQRGALELSESENDICITLIDRPSDLHPHQAHLLAWLFRDANTLWISTLNAEKDYEKASQFNKEYNTFCSMTMDDAIRMGLLHDNKGTIWFGFAVCGLFALIAVALLMMADAYGFTLLAAVLGIALCIGCSRINRLTEDGQRCADALHGFIAHYQDAPPADPSSAASRAPIAIALGMAQPFAKWMEQSVPTADAYDDDYPLWMSMHYHHHMVHMNRRFHDVQHHNARVSNPNDSGSSGGSSGGSGGSSHGAW